jgi:hypothetical protein
VNQTTEERWTAYDSDDDGRAWTASIVAGHEIDPADGESAIHQNLFGLFDGPIYGVRDPAGGWTSDPAFVLPVSPIDGIASAGSRVVVLGSTDGPEPALVVQSNGNWSAPRLIFDAAGATWLAGPWDRSPEEERRGELLEAIPVHADGTFGANVTLDLEPLYNRLTGRHAREINVGKNDADRVRWDAVASGESLHFWIGAEDELGGSAVFHARLHGGAFEPPVLVSACAPGACRTEFQGAKSDSDEVIFFVKTTAAGTDDTGDGIPDYNGAVTMRWTLAYGSGPGTFFTSSSLGAFFEAGYPFGPDDFVVYEWPELGIVAGNIGGYHYVH